MPSSRSETGYLFLQSWYLKSANIFDLLDCNRTALQNNCDVDADNNAGCGVQVTDTRSFGPIFNDHGGGW
jgi:hypothetical protein